MLAKSQWSNTNSVIFKWGTFSLLLSFFLLLLSSNFIVWGVKSSCFKFNQILLYFQLLLIYIWIGSLSVIVSCFLIMHWKYLWLTDREYDLSSNSDPSFYVGANILNLLFYIAFRISSCKVDTTILYYNVSITSFLTLFARLSLNLYWSAVLLFSDVINIVSVLLYLVIDFFCCNY